VAARRRRANDERPLEPVIEDELERSLTDGGAR
jgi:hypothetical protein